MALKIDERVAIKLLAFGTLLTYSMEYSPP